MLAPIVTSSSTKLEPSNLARRAGGERRVFDLQSETDVVTLNGNAVSTFVCGTRLNVPDAMVRNGNEI